MHTWPCEFVCLRQKLEAPGDKQHRGRRENGVLGEAYLEVEGVKVMEHPLS